MLTRNQFLKGAAAVVGGAGLTGCGEVVRRVSAVGLPERIGQEAAAGDDPAWRLLNRAAFGPRPGDLERVRSITPDGWIEEQLAPERINEPWAAWMRLLPMDTLDADAEWAEEMETAVFPEVGKGQTAIELQTACLLRAVYSARQLQEVMVDFWTDHFNVSQLKAECSWLKTVDDRLIRQHALGRFEDLVKASARSPAMLFYLDNDKNKKRDPETGSGSNENYARELLELHTLGVDGGYTLKDIQEVARCFTGWTYRKGFVFDKGAFVFNAQDHDTGPKEVLGHLIAGSEPDEPGNPALRSAQRGLRKVLGQEAGGLKDGERVIQICCAHPSTARFIARKLCRRFVADRGPDSLIATLAQTYTRTGGDIKQMLSVLLHSEEFRHSPARKFKRPFDFTVSALRATNADTTGGGVLPYLERMGQLPYKWTMPDGYPDRVEAWTPSLLARWNFAVDLAANQVPGTSVNPGALLRATRTADAAGQCAALARVILGAEPPRPALEKLAALPGRREETARQWMALLLSSPQFQWR
jgi:uncharacterized protein (DUF1800 family)